MKKVNFLIALVFGLQLSSVSLAADHNLYGYELRSDGKTVISTKTTFQSVSLPEKKSWFDYVVTLNVNKSYKDKDGSTKQWVDKVNFHFNSEKRAKVFTKVMSGPKGTDLYFNSSENSNNSKGTVSSCVSPLLGLFCWDFGRVTIINWKDIDADEAFALDAATGKNIPLMQYLDRAESGKIALLEDADGEDLSHSVQADNSEREISPKHDLDEDKSARPVQTGAVSA